MQEGAGRAPMEINNYFLNVVVRMMFHTQLHLRLLLRQFAVHIPFHGKH